MAAAEGGCGLYGVLINKFEHPTEEARPMDFRGAVSICLIFVVAEGRAPTRFARRGF